MSDDTCGCLKCYDQRRMDRIAVGKPYYLGMAGPGIDHWRYACELCGNKRCPHHSDHALACTRSNERGQEGSIFA